MSDLIDRQAAIEAADSIINRDTSGNNDVVKAMTAWKEYIKALPSAQKTGHWIMKEKMYGGLIENRVYRYECSECGFSDEHNSSREVPFCWHCGARMEAAQEWSVNDMNWIKTGKTTGPDGTVIFYELAGTEFWIESRTEHIPHANGIGTWDHTTYVVRKGPDCPELAVKNRLKDAKRFVEEFIGGSI